MKPIPAARTFLNFCAKLAKKSSASSANLSEKELPPGCDKFVTTGLFHRPEFSTMET
jgi:hypothetical protein